jgi:UDP-sugar diphosphatase
MAALTTSTPTSLSAPPPGGWPLPRWWSPAGAPPDTTAAGRITSARVAPLTEPSRFVTPLRMWFQRTAAPGSCDDESAAAPALQPDAAAAAPLPAPRTLVWDLLAPTDSVAVLVYHADMRAYLAVRQFRPPVLLAEWTRRQRRRAGAVATAAAAGSSGDTATSATATTAGMGGLSTPTDVVVPPADELAALAAGGVGFTLELCAGLIDTPPSSAMSSLRAVACDEVAQELGYTVPPSALVPLFAFPEAVNLTGARLSAFYARVTEADRVGAGGGLDGEGEAIDVVALPAEPAALRALLRSAAAATLASGDEDDSAQPTTAMTPASLAATAASLSSPLSEPLSCDLQLALRIALADGLGPG